MARRRLTFVPKLPTFRICYHPSIRWSSICCCCCCSVYEDELCVSKRLTLPRKVWHPSYPKIMSAYSSMTESELLRVSLSLAGCGPEPFCLTASDSDPARISMECDPRMQAGPGRSDPGSVVSSSVVAGPGF